MRSKKSDCELVGQGFEDTFNNLGGCFESLMDDRKTKMNVIGSIFKFGMSATKLTVNIGVCAIKKAPKAIATVSVIKQEIVSEVESSYIEYKKQEKINALDNRIKALSYKRT